MTTDQARYTAAHFVLARRVERKALDALGEAATPESRAKYLLNLERTSAYLLRFADFPFRDFADDEAEWSNRAAVRERYLERAHFLYNEHVRTVQEYQRARQAYYRDAGGQERNPEERFRESGARGWASYEEARRDREDQRELYPDPGELLGDVYFPSAAPRPSNAVSPGDENQSNDEPTNTGPVRNFGDDVEPREAGRRPRWWQWGPWRRR